MSDPKLWQQAQDLQKEALAPTWRPPAALVVAQLPAWEVSELNRLSQTGMLYKVPSIILQAIDIAESGGQGGFINSLGFGGFFGLGYDQPYPTGSLSFAELIGTDMASFDAQALVASGLFAHLLTERNGDVYAAETIYQGGSSYGVSIMEDMGINEYLIWPPPIQESGMFFVWNGNVYFAPGLLFSYGGSVYFANETGGFQLVKNGLKAVLATNVYIVPDVQAGLYNNMIVGKTGKPKATILTQNGVAAAQAAAQNGNIIIIQDINAGLYNQLVVGNEG